MDGETLRTGVEVAGGGVMAVASYFIKGHNDRISNIEKKNQDTQKNLDDHRLDSEKRFAKEETVQSSLGRIHDRVDDLGENINKRFDTLTTMIQASMSRK